MDLNKLDMIDDTMNNRKIARKLVNEAATKGNSIAGALESLENLVSPYYLGIDSDDNDDDLNVFP